MPDNAEDCLNSHEAELIAALWLSQTCHRCWPFHLPILPDVSAVMVKHKAFEQS